MTNAIVTHHDILRDHLLACATPLPPTLPLPPTHPQRNETTHQHLLPPDLPLTLVLLLQDSEHNEDDNDDNGHQPKNTDGDTWKGQTQ